MPLAVSGLALVLAGCAGDSGSEAAGDGRADKPRGPVKIGVLVPLSGDSTETGVDLLNAAKLAADEINADGGILGQRVEVVEADDSCDPQAGTAAARKLLEQKVVGVAGGYCSAAVIPGSAVLDASGLPIITLATNPDVTERGLTSVFRITGRDDRQGSFAARFLAGAAGARKLAILHNNTVYSKGLADHTRAANDALGLGMQVVFFDAIARGGRDYRPALTEVRASGADTLYFTGYAAEAGLVVRQAKELNLPVRLIGGDATNEPVVITTAGPSAEGFAVTTAPLPEFLPGAFAFINAFTERFGAPPGPFSVYEYDAVKVLAGAITRAASIDPDEVMATLRETRHGGITGEISFDAKGDRQTIFYLTAIVRDGRFTPHKKLGANGQWIDG